jgi:hypothetical protein
MGSTTNISTSRHEGCRGRSADRGVEVNIHTHAFLVDSRMISTKKQKKTHPSLLNLAAPPCWSIVGHLHARIRYSKSGRLANPASLASDTTYRRLTINLFQGLGDMHRMLHEKATMNDEQDHQLVLGHRLCLYFLGITRKATLSVSVCQNLKSTYYNCTLSLSCIS